jgi:hypothetical protein
MSIRADVSIQAIETLATQARIALRYMAVSSTNPNDLDTAMALVNGTQETVVNLLRAADVM